METIFMDRAQKYLSNGILKSKKYLIERKLLMVNVGGKI